MMIEYKYNDTRDAREAAEQLYNNIDAVKSHLENANEYEGVFYNKYKDKCAVVTFYRTDKNDVFRTLAFYDTVDKSRTFYKEQRITRLMKPNRHAL